MSAEDDIAFLEAFRRKIEDYLVLGYAPMSAPLFPSATHAKWKERESTPEMRALRREINEAKGRAIQILDQCRVGTIWMQHPPPAVGGPVIRSQLFDLVTDNIFLRPIEVAKFTDAIDTAIGILKARPAEKEGVPPHIQTEVTKGFVFIAMPMDESNPALADVHDAIKSVALDLGLTAERVDDQESNERITDRVLESISRAEYVVADLSGGRPNVYYEAGYAHALGKTPIYIAREGTKVEFDLKDYPVLFFPNMKTLREKLAKRLRALQQERTG